MCKVKSPEPLAPPPAAPPVLEQAAPKSAASSTSNAKKKRQGMSRYKLTPESASAPSTSNLGGIPKKVGTGS